MDYFQITAVLLTLAALFAFINLRLIKLPMTIGVMLLALLMSLALVVAGQFRPVMHERAAHILQHIDFENLLLHGMLSLLLFAGSLHIDLSDLRSEKWPIFLLATAGVVLSTFIVGGATWLVLRVLHLPLPLMHCLLFGALISPTDPIAVLGIMKTANAPRPLQVQVSGESLFNDGIGVVVFLVLMEISRGGAVGPIAIAKLLLSEAIGGAAVGAGIGFLVFLMLRKINQYNVEILMTLALATGIYALAERLHFSAPIAVVAAGLLIGNHGRSFAMSEETRDRLDGFWELIDEILNAVLFVLIGLEMLVVSKTRAVWIATACVIPVILLARWVSVIGIILPLRRWNAFVPGTITVLTWAGLRGGISVALALSLPGEYNREPLLAITYGVVVFSILVQGLTVGPLARRLAHRHPI